MFPNNHLPLADQMAQQERFDKLRGKPLKIDPLTMDLVEDVAQTDPSYLENNQLSTRVITLHIPRNSLLEASTWDWSHSSVTQVTVGLEFVEFPRTP